MPLPIIRSVTDSSYRQVELLKCMEIGKFTIWFVMDKTFVYATIVAFQVQDGVLHVRVPVGADEPEISELTHEVPGARLGDWLEEPSFEKVWESETDGYLFPKRVGKLKMNWPGLTPDIPLGVLADWLQDHGCEKAAMILRGHEGTAG